MKRFIRSRGRPALQGRRRAVRLAALLALALLAGTGFLPAPQGVIPPGPNAPGSGLVEPGEDPAVFEKIEKALSAGRAEQVLAVAGPQVEIRLFGRGTLYSKAQALYVLAAFLERYPPARFAFSDYATTDDRRFAFGSYWVRGQQAPFQVYVNLRQREGGWELRELRVELP